jgi:hypothetical protein
VGPGAGLKVCLVAKLSSPTKEGKKWNENSTDKTNDLPYLGVIFFGKRFVHLSPPFLEKSGDILLQL